ncbi:MAG: hypothetical protein ABIH25_03655 [Candidatus Woesearchaeota archaeon]
MNKLERLVVRALKHSIKDFDEKNLLEKSIKIGEKTAICGFPIFNPGMVPHKIQYRTAEEAGMKPATQTLYSAGVGVGLGIVKYGVGLGGTNIDDVFNVNVPSWINTAFDILKYVGVYSFIDASVRLSYASITKKPLGTFLLEISYLGKEKIWDKYIKK